MKYFDFTYNGTEGYLIEGSKTEEEIVLETLTGLGVEWDVERYIQGKLFIHTDDKKNTELALETCREHMSNFVAARISYAD